MADLPRVEADFVQVDEPIGNATFAITTTANPEPVTVTVTPVVDVVTKPLNIPAPKAEPTPAPADPNKIDLPPIPLNEFGTPLYTPAAWLRKYKREHGLLDSRGL